jgi:hypothetical protein
MANAMITQAKTPSTFGSQPPIGQAESGAPMTYTRWFYRAPAFHAKQEWPASGDILERSPMGVSCRLKRRPVTSFVRGFVSKGAH